MREDQLSYEQMDTDLLRELQALNETITKTREALGPLVEKPAQPYSRTEILNDEHSTVVEFGRQWYEIACCFCGANKSKATPRLFKGWNALLQHVRGIHEVKKTVIENNELFTWCARRSISNDHAMRARGGLQDLGIRRRWDKGIGKQGGGRYG